MLLIKMACGATSPEFENEVKHLGKKGFNPQYSSFRIAPDGWFYMCMERNVITNGEIRRAKAQLAMEDKVKEESETGLFAD